MARAGPRSGAVRSWRSSRDGPAAWDQPSPNGYSSCATQSFLSLRSTGATRSVPEIFHQCRAVARWGLGPGGARSGLQPWRVVQSGACTPLRSCCRCARSSRTWRTPGRAFPRSTASKLPGERGGSGASLQQEFMKRLLIVVSQNRCLEPSWTLANLSAIQTVFQPRVADRSDDAALQLAAAAQKRCRSACASPGDG